MVPCRPGNSMRVPARPPSPASIERRSSSESVSSCTVGSSTLRTPSGSRSATGRRMPDRTGVRHSDVVPAGRRLLDLQRRRDGPRARRPPARVPAARASAASGEVARSRRGRPSGGDGARQRARTSPASSRRPCRQASALWSASHAVFTSGSTSSKVRHAAGRQRLDEDEVPAVAGLDRPLPGAGLSARRAPGRTPDRTPWRAARASDRPVVVLEHERDRRAPSPPASPRARRRACSSAVAASSRARGSPPVGREVEVTEGDRGPAARSGPCSCSNHVLSSSAVRLVRIGDVLGEELHLLRHPPLDDGVVLVEARARGPRGRGSPRGPCSPPGSDISSGVGGRCHCDGERDLELPQIVQRQLDLARGGRARRVRAARAPIAGEQQRVRAGGNASSGSRTTRRNVSRSALRCSGRRSRNGTRRRASASSSHIAMPSAVGSLPSEHRRAYDSRSSRSRTRCCARRRT